MFFNLLLLTVPQESREQNLLALDPTRQMLLEYVTKKRKYPQSIQSTNVLEIQDMNVYKVTRD